MARIHQAGHGHAALKKTAGAFLPQVSSGGAGQCACNGKGLPGDSNMQVFTPYAGREHAQDYMLCGFAKLYGQSELAGGFVFKFGLKFGQTREVFKKSVHNTSVAISGYFPRLPFCQSTNKIASSLSITGILFCTGYTTAQLWQHSPSGFSGLPCGCNTLRQVGQASI